MAVSVPEMPNLLAYGKELSSSISSASHGVADAMAQFGKFKHDEEVRQKSIDQLKQEFPEVAAKHADEIGQMPLKEIANTAATLRAYKGIVEENKKTFPDYNPISPEAVFEATQGAEHKDVLPFLQKMREDAKVQQQDASVGQEKQQVSALSQGLNTPTDASKKAPLPMAAPEGAFAGAPNEGQSASPQYMGQTLRGQAEAAGRQPSQEDYYKGVSGLGLGGTDKTKTVVEEGAKQYQTGKTQEDEATKRQKLEIDKQFARAKGQKIAAEIGKIKDDTTAKEMALAITAFEKDNNLQAYFQKMLNVAQTQSANATAIDPKTRKPKFDPKTQEAMQQNAKDFEDGLMSIKDNIDAAHEFNSSFREYLEKKHGLKPFTPASAVPAATGKPKKDPLGIF
jgi:hypothetical protein